MPLSSSQRDRLSKLLDEGVFYFKGTFDKAQVMRQIEEIVHTPSFSEQIIEASQVKRRCSLGHLHVTYRLHFRVTLIPALRILVEAGKPMTTGEVAELLPTHVGRMMYYLSELRHWGLLTQPKTGVYLATPQARAFLEGTLAVPSWLWPKGEKLPEECQDGPLKYVDEFTGEEHPKDDASRHVEEAVPEPAF